MFSFITKKLWIHFMSCISLVIIIILTVLILNGIDSQNSFHNSQVKEQNQLLADAVEGGMFDALAIGDNDVVKNQFKRLSEKLSGLKVFVYDFNGKISFTTDTKYQGKDIAQLIGSEAGSGVKNILNSAKNSEEVYHYTFNEEPYTISSQIIVNENRCFHCHGGSRKVLGGITVCSSEAISLKKIRESRNRSLAIGAGGLIIIIFMIWILFHYLVNTKIAFITTVSSKMGEGDFTSDIVVTGKNEISTILAGTRKINNELREMIRKIVENCNELGLFSVSLEKVSSNMLKNATATSDKSEMVAVAAKEMSSDLNTIASAMDDTAANVDMMASASEEMHATATEISKNTAQAKYTIEKAAESFNHTAEVVEELGKAADAIDKVTDNIREISEQVSLLALNAKIEAARAGVAGKGFAVVADEISELAVETSDATINVDKTLRWMKDKAKETVASIKIVSKTIEDSEEAISTIASAVEEQAITTQEIANSITKISEGVSLVNKTVNDGAVNARRVAEDLSVIDAAADDITSSSHSVNEKSMELRKMSDNLMNMMKYFKV